MVVCEAVILISCYVNKDFREIDRLLVFSGTTQTSLCMDSIESQRMNPRYFSVCAAVTLPADLVPMWSALCCMFSSVCLHYLLWHT